MVVLSGVLRHATDGGQLSAPQRAKPLPTQIWLHDASSVPAADVFILPSEAAKQAE